MKLEKHVLYSIEHFERNDKEAALMHACIAIEATARNFYKKESPTNNDYKACIRHYWWLVEPFIGGGLNLEETKWSNVVLNKKQKNQIINPDLADIIYHIFRCNLAHAKEVPIQYALTPTRPGNYHWLIGTQDERVHMPESVIWALLAVSVFSRANSGINTDTSHFLSWVNANGSQTEFIIKDYWGKEDRIREFLSTKKHIRVKLQVAGPTK